MVWHSVASKVERRIVTRVYSKADEMTAWLGEKQAKMMTVWIVTTKAAQKDVNFIYFA